MLLTPHDEAVIARLRQKKAELVALEGFGLDTRVTVVGGRFVGRRGRVTRLTTMAGAPLRHLRAAPQRAHGEVLPPRHH